MDDVWTQVKSVEDKGFKQLQELVADENTIEALVERMELLIGYKLSDSIFVLPIEIESVPYKIQIRLGVNTYELEVHFNPSDETFTLDLLKSGVALAYGEKLIYNRILFEAVRDQEFPGILIIPTDLSGVETHVLPSNFTSSVHLLVLVIADG
jgi:hypothetical protein